MRIHHASVLVIFSLLAGHSAQADDWEVVASANAGRQANSLASVAAVADTGVWGVGWGPRGEVDVWGVVTTAKGGRKANILASVAAVADTDVWAVGWAFNQSLFAYRTLIEHWNGTRGSLVRSPNATNGYNLLNGVGVVGANNVWAVGQAANGSTYSTLVE